MAPRPKRTKRTFNLAESTLGRERLSLELRERAEGERWAGAAVDPDFQQEMRDVQRDLRYAEATGPEA